MDEWLAFAFWREKKVPVIVARFFNTVGPRQTGRYGMVLPNFARQALKGEPITVYGSGEQSRCFGHVADVVKAVDLLIHEPDAVGQVINIGCDEEVTIEQPRIPGAAPNVSTYQAFISSTGPAKWM